MAIISSILEEERNPKKLAKLKDGRIRSRASVQEISTALGFDLVSQSSPSECVS